MFAVGVAIWTGWTLRHARRHRLPAAPRGELAPHTRTPPPMRRPGPSRTHALVLALVLLPMAAYVYGALALGWGFNQLSAAFLLGGVAAGLTGGLGLTGTMVAYVEGMQALLPAAVMVGLARSISLVLDEGRVVDTVLFHLVAPLSHAPAIVAAVAMIPFQALLHIAVPSVSGQAVLTMPLFVPMADVLRLSRQVPVLAYQTGAGLMELATPTNGALMAILLAADVPFSRWLRFALGGLLLLSGIGVLGVLR
jgi:uncharacterized ion transporter superfamily protein YfcC